MKTILLVLCSVSLGFSQTTTGSHYSYTTDNTRNQLANLQNQLRDIQNSLRDAQALQQMAERRAQAQSEQSSQQADVESIVSYFERKLISGSGLTDSEVEWVKAAGYFGRTKAHPVYLPYVDRLYTIYYTEYARRKVR